MTVKINADTSDGLKFVSDTSGTVDIQSNGTTKLTVGTTIDCQGNELVLDSDADTSIHASTDDEIDIKVGGTDVGKFDSTGLEVTSASAPCDLTIKCPNNTGNSSIFLGDTDDIDVGMIEYGHTANDMGFYTNATRQMLIDSDGHIGVGITSIQAHLHVDSEDTGSTFGRAALAVTTGDPTVNSSNQLVVLAFTGDNDTTNEGTAGTFISFRDSGGEIGTIDGASSTTVVYGTSSDYRLKENVNYSFDATSRLKQLKPARFNFTKKPDVTVDGFLAHEVSSIVPEAIVGTKDQTKEAKNVVKKADGRMIHENVTEAEWTQGKADGTYANDTTWSATATVPVYQSIDQSKLVPLLVKTIQELEARITALESE